MNRNDYAKWVLEALKELGGKGSIIEVAKIIWKNHKSELESSGDYFYSWQYDFRWGAYRLRKKGIMREVKESHKGIWELK